MNGASDGRGEGIHLNLGRVNLAAMEPVRLPRMVPVRQRFDARRIDPEDMEAIIGGQFRREDVRGKITPGMRIAVGVGSRGIENLALIVRAVVQELKKLGAVPVHRSGHGQSWRRKSGRPGAAARRVWHSRRECGSAGPGLDGYRLSGHRA